MRCICTFIYSTCQKQVRKKHRGWHLAASKVGLKEKLIGGLALRNKVVKIRYVHAIFKFLYVLCSASSLEVQFILCSSLLSEKLQNCLKTWHLADAYRWEMPLFFLVEIPLIVISSCDSWFQEPGHDGPKNKSNNKAFEHFAQRCELEEEVSWLSLFATWLTYHIHFSSLQ